VEFVACRNNSFAQNRDFGRRYETGRCCCDRLGVNNGEGEQARPVVCRRTGKDTVVVLWITLRLHQSFATAVGAPSEVGALRCGAVERRDDGFGDASHFMNASITEVDDLRRMAQSPSSVDGRAGVSRVRASGNVAMLERGSEFEVIDGASEAAVRETLKLAIPILERHPDFDVDVGIGSGMGFRNYPAEGGQLFVERGDVGPGKRMARPGEFSSCLCFGSDDGDVRNAQFRESLAFLRNRCVRLSGDKSTAEYEGDRDNQERNLHRALPAS